MLRIFLLLFLASVTSVQARPWPETFSRNVYHKWYTENRVATFIPLSVPLDPESASTPRYLSYIVGYTYYHIKDTEVQLYFPPYHCNMSRNAAIYDGWAYMIAIDQSTLRDCE